MADWFKKTILSSNALQEYVLETSAYPKEHQQLMEIREATIDKYKEWSMMNVAADEGQFLSVLLKIINGKKTMGIGVFTGYSLLTTALALPEDGKIVAIDPDKEAYEVGLPFIKKAGIEHKINYIPSDAFPLLNDLIYCVSAVLTYAINDQSSRKHTSSCNFHCLHGEEDTFDFIYVDASENDCLKFHELALKLVKIGRIIADDNTLFLGSVAKSDKEIMEEPIRKLRNFVIEFNRFITADPRVESSLLSIGDGLTLCRRLY
ncbi:hypothetical protein QUC31_014468 [Theobroma cacao]